MITNLTKYKSALVERLMIDASIDEGKNVFTIFYPILYLHKSSNRTYQSP